MTRTCAALVLLAVLVPGAAGARAAASADASVSLAIAIPPAPAAGRPFSVEVAAANDGPDPTHLDVHVLLPEGLRYAGGGACAGTGDLVCLDADAPPGFRSARVLLLVADGPGRYTITARVLGLTAPDPDPENNEVGLGVAVQAAPALVPARFQVAPSRPRAGLQFVASFRVLDRASGAFVAPTAATCRTTVGRARARTAAGKAICAIRTPESSRGSVLRAVVVADAAGVRVAKRFALRLR